MEQVLESVQSLKQRLKDAEEKCNEKRLTSDEAEIIFTKLKSHYKLPPKYHLRFTDRLRSCSGRCNYWGRILLRWKTDLHTLCHEVAHAIDFTEDGIRKHKRYHSKKFYRLVSRVCLYCVNHNFWTDELKKRLEPKPIKPEPTESESRLIRIKKKQDDLLRYEKKLKYYTKLYTNKIKRARRSIVMLERNGTRDAIANDIGSGNLPTTK